MLGIKLWIFYQRYWQTLLNLNLVPSHKIQKKETKQMTKQQVKLLDLEEREMLIEDVIQDRFISGFIKDLKIDSNNESSSRENQNINSNNDLLEEPMKCFKEIQ